MTRTTCLALALIIAAAAQAADYEKALFDFKSAEAAKGWRANVWGKNPQGAKGTTRIELVAGRIGGKALRLSSQNAGRYNFISRPLPDGPWRSTDYSAVAVWYKGDGVSARGSRFVVQTESLEKDKKGRPITHTYSKDIDLTNRDWKRLVLRGFYQPRGNPPLDLSRIRRIYVSGEGTRQVTLGSVALISAGRDVHLEPRNLPQVRISELAATPTLDGNLNDAAWKGATRFGGMRVFGLTAEPAKYVTDAWIGLRGTTLYLAAHMKGEKPDAIPAKQTLFDTPVWKDSCLEFYLDPGDTNAKGYQFCVNAIGTRLDICSTRAWNGVWQAKAARHATDGWTVEISCDLKSLGATPKVGDVWGFNLKRHVVSPKGRFTEISGWSQGRPQPVSGYGALIFGAAPRASVEAPKPEMREFKGGDYVCRATLRHKGKAPLKAKVNATVTSSRGAEKWTATADATAAPEAVLNLKLPIEVKRDGKYALITTTRDTAGRVLSYAEYDFYLSRVAPFNYSDIVLCPPPQKITMGKGVWKIPDNPTLHRAGKGDAFPANHLIEKIRARYNIQTGLVKQAAAGIVMTYDGKGLKPEGYALDVTKDGVRIRAGSGRGMYYGVRTLLDLMQQSTLRAGEACVAHVSIRDWPQILTRVFYHRIDTGYRIDMGVRAYKDLIYDQIAGRKMNLLILNVRGGMRYDTHPEIAYGPALTKAQMREIVTFAKRHYVDVAPGGNTPGHGNWVTRRHPDLREDGDQNTVCTRHPETLPLLKDLYGELIDLFDKPKYFHIGADEVRWKTSSTPEAKRCKRCKGIPKRDLVLEHWSALADFVRSRGCRPIMWVDMLASKWNGGGVHQVAKILPRLPKDMIIATWTCRELDGPATDYTKHGLTSWSVQTSFAPSKMDDMGKHLPGREALGIAQFITWPWSNLLHHSYRTVTKYSTPAIHSCAAVGWKPATYSLGGMRIIALQGRHWMKSLNVTEWGARKLRYAPLDMKAACNSTTRDAKSGDDKGWLDLGPTRDLRTLPSGTIKVGAASFKRPATGNDCVVLRGAEKARPIAVGRKARGFVFLHTAAASREQVTKLYRRFRLENMSHYSMPIAWYRVRYASNRVVSVPVKIGWSVHLWDCYPPARVMPGARSYWVGLTDAQRKRDPNAPDACVWTMEWKNPWPLDRIEDITFVGAGTEATVALFGITTVM